MPNSSATLISMAQFSKGELASEADFADASFSGGAFFDDAEFEKDAIFSLTRFGNHANFKGVRFKTEADFQGCKFSISSIGGVGFNGVRFGGPVHLDWTQLVGAGRQQNLEQLKLYKPDITAWKALERVFKSSGDLEGENEAHYQRRSLEPSGFWKSADRILWGFGVRPQRILAWMIGMFLFFTAIYWTQTAGMTNPECRWKRAISRVVYAMRFSAQTSWKWNFGWQHARTREFKAVVAIQRVFFVVGLGGFFLALSNVNPLLEKLLSKLIPH